ncbi:Gp49 family protein [Cytobacillus sp. FSL W8-0315]|uniref:Gp49 family protein n=1 Tax=Cytobacillus sp. FSL W8-0315 TaxID=2921600 RepID=UPI0030FAFF1A
MSNNKVTQEHIQKIMDNSEFEISTAFDKCTVVSCKLPSGFVITESSACVDPANYDIKLGAEICTKRIVDKVWELEGYKLQHSMK